MAELYRKSGGDKFGLAGPQFAAILTSVAAKYLPAGAGKQEHDELYRGLRVEELALARACAAGNEKAWEAFLLRYRAKIYDMAAYIARESSAARDLADSIYADLYGTETRDGRRACKLASYTGRGSLEGWLRTVMAQEFVNRYRRQRRLVSLDGDADDEDNKADRLPSPDPEPVVAVNPQLEAAADEALAALSAEERFLLAAYYLDGRTLADISGQLGVHESTISRKLDKVAKALRKQILGSLVSTGMSRRQAEEAMEVDVRDLQVNLRNHLTQKAEPETFSKKKAEVQRGDGAGIPEV
jgi:RNA polymerase sigma-70 factor (ECF subfamily)